MHVNAGDHMPTGIEVDGIQLTHEKATRDCKPALVLSSTKHNRFPVLIEDFDAHRLHPDEVASRDFRNLIGTHELGVGAVDLT